MAIETLPRLDSYPGAALSMSATGDVLVANARAEGVVLLLASGSLLEVAELVKEAANSSTIAAGTVSVPTDNGDILLEVTVLPEDGADSLIVLARDLTMERNLRSALVESRQRYKDLVEVSSDFYWETDPQGKFVFVSPRGGLGHASEDLIDRDGSEFVVDPEAFSPLPFVSERPLEDVEMWFMGKDEETACMLVSCVPLFREDENGREWSGTRGVCRDVTEERRSEAALSRARHREQLLGYIVSSVRDELDPQNMLTAAATTTARALGVAGCRIYRQTEPDKVLIAAEYGNTEELEELDESIRDLGLQSEVKLVEIGPWSTLAVATHYRQEMNGAITIWRSAKGDPWEDDHLILIADIANQLGIANEQVTNHERVVALSRTDSMTGLLNRRAFFEEELPRRASRLERSRESAALFYVDMDNFKLVNDTHGHQTGDDAIMFLRDMLIDFSRPGDVIARLGGDEFAMWLDGISSEVAEVRATSLIKQSQPMLQFSGDDDHPLGISVGIAVYEPDTHESIDDLLARADAAMYAIKNAGKGGFHMAPPAVEGSSEGS
ncbi:MAG: sensor domain-containing diguanylate cyclase [Rhodospirillaceae bacterium]|nr:sensor domain-containing diguanylate cyclase [Rhodospirillaceae bacterium]MBT6883365.1 sensor domain-containing diguanylate cyclase [Rhodospirillaceae bacterium]